jgi:hypothetical protein
MWARANQHRFPIDTRTILGNLIAARDVSPSSAEHP